MEKSRKILLLLFCLITSNLWSQKVPTNGQFCHNQDKGLECFSWYRFHFHLNNGELKDFHSSDSVLIYNVNQKILEINSRKGTIVLQLKENGVELISKKDSQLIYLPLSQKEDECDNSDSINLIKLNKLGGWGILPIVQKKCKIVGLQFPGVRNTVLTILFFRGVKNKILFWDFIFTGIEKNNEIAKIKFFSNDYDGLPASINLSHDQGFSVFDYKKPDQGTEVLFNSNGLPRTVLKVRDVLKTERKGYIIFTDVFEYSKKAKLGKSGISIQNCRCN